MFYRWSCDLVGKLPQSFRGNVYIMIMIEHFSKWVELVMLSDKSSHSTSHVFLQHVLNRFGACAECLTNQGSKFKGEFQNLLDHVLINHRWTSKDHHWEQRGLGPGPTLYCHGLHDVQTCLFVSFRSLLSIFWKTFHSTLFHCCSSGPGCGLGFPSCLG